MPKTDISHVEATEDADGRWSVWPYWTNVDRPRGAGWGGLRPDVADRLMQAIIDGAAHGDPEIRIDTSGNTYVYADSKVSGRMANADLRRLGY